MIWNSISIKQKAIGARRMSIFLSNCHHAFAKIDGSVGWPNSLEGDLLKQAHKEIKEADAEIERLNARLKVLQLALRGPAEAAYGITSKEFEAALFGENDIKEHFGIEGE